MLVADFAEGLNDNLANIVMSRVWDRSIVNSTFVLINTGESTGPLPIVDYVNWTSQLASQDTFVITYLNSGGTGSGSCSSSAPPTIGNLGIYDQIGSKIISTIPISNANDNITATIGGITYTPPNGLQIFTSNWIPATLNPGALGNFQVQINVGNSTKPGTYKINATAPFSSLYCSSVSGMISFTIT